MTFASGNLRQVAFFLFCALLLASASELIWKHPFTNFDDFALVEPLLKIHSLADYSRAIERNQIMDIAPVRDFSYWLELQFQSITGLLNHQLVNILIWIATVFIFTRILMALAVANEIIAVATLVVGLHPVMHQSVFWIAGRKHLLSAFFLTFATLFLLRAMRSDRAGFYIGSFACFLLSCLAQPIGIGFPLFAVVLILSHRGRETIHAGLFTVAIFVVALWVSFLNLEYYSSDSYANTGGMLAPKFNAESLDLLLKRFLIWGRDTFQLVIPLRPSITPYNLDSPTSLIGLALLAIIVCSLIKVRRSWKEIAPWIVYLSLPIAAVTVKLTSQGGFDTYLLTPLIGAGITLSVLAKTQHLRVTRRRAIVVAAIATFFTAVNFKMAHAWANPDELWAVALEMEDSRMARSVFLQQRLNDPNFDPAQAMTLALKIRKDDPSNPDLGSHLGKTIFVQRVDASEKDALFQRLQVADVWYDYYWSANDAIQGRFDRATERLFSRFQSDPRLFMIKTAYNISDIATRWTKMCELANRRDCAEIAEMIEGERERMSKAKR